MRRKMLRGLGLSFILGLVFGGYIASKFIKPETQVITLTKTDVKYKNKIVTLPDGSKTETIESQSVSESNMKKKYGVGLYHDKSVFLESRLGDMPLFLIGETDFKEVRVGIKLEF